MTEKQISEFYNLLKRTSCECATQSPQSNAHTQFMNLYRKAAFKQGLAVRDYLYSVHPLLAVRYFAAWDKDTSIRDRNFWKKLDSTWTEACYKKKYAFSLGLEDYDWNSLKREMEELFTEVTPDGKRQSVQIPQGYEDYEFVILYLQERWYTRVEREREETERKKREQEEKIARAQQEGALRQQRELEDEKRRLQKQQEAQESAAMFRQAANGKMPWNSSVTAKPVCTENGLSVSAVPATQVLGEVFEEQGINLSSIFETEDDGVDILQPRYPQPNDWEVSVKALPDYSRKSGLFQFKFGKSISKAILYSGFTCMHVLTDRLGQRYIYFNEQPGIKMATPQENKDGSANVIINSKEVATAMLDLYKQEKFCLFEMSENMSQNDALVAFLIKKVRSC